MELCIVVPNVELPLNFLRRHVIFKTVAHKNHNANKNWPTAKSIENVLFTKHSLLIHRHDRGARARQGPYLKYQSILPRGPALTFTPNIVYQLHQL